MLETDAPDGLPRLSDDWAGALPGLSDEGGLGEGGVSGARWTGAASRCGGRHRLRWAAATAVMPTTAPQLLAWTTRRSSSIIQRMSGTPTVLRYHCWSMHNSGAVHRPHKGNEWRSEACDAQCQCHAACARHSDERRKAHSPVDLCRINAQVVAALRDQSVDDVVAAAATAYARVFGLSKAA